MTPWDNEHWTVASVGTIVRNRVYLGEARAGKIVNPDAHEPIVTLAEWQAANKARGVHPGRSGKGTGAALRGPALRGMQLRDEAEDG